MTTTPLKKGATYEDLREVPDHFVAEIFDGDLHASPRPALPHANASSALLSEIHKSFHRKGQSGWVILFEPELHFGRDVLVPDLAGWRRTRLPNDAREGVAHAWLVDLLARSLEVMCLAAGRWTPLDRYEGEAKVRRVPFDAVEFELGALWI